MNIAAYQERLKQLKREETLIVDLLCQIRKQLNRYKVEELHLSSISEANKSARSQDSDSDVDEETLKEVAKTLKCTGVDWDCAEKINEKHLNLMGTVESDFTVDEDDSD